MSDPQTDDPGSYPALGRMIARLDRPGIGTKMFRGLVIVCVLLFFADFTYKKYGVFAVESWPGFYGVYGFVSVAAVILLAKALRGLVGQPQDFYGDKSVDAEDYPASGLERQSHDAD